MKMDRKIEDVPFTSTGGISRKLSKEDFENLGKNVSYYVMAYPKEIAKKYLPDYVIKNPNCRKFYFVIGVDCSLLYRTTNQRDLKIFLKDEGFTDQISTFH
jgi:hypothetical protein